MKKTTILINDLLNSSSVFSDHPNKDSRYKKKIVNFESLLYATLNGSDLI